MTGWPSNCVPSKQEMIYVATHKCSMSLATPINVILYDRLAKRSRTEQAEQEGLLSAHTSKPVDVTGLRL